MLYLITRICQFSHVKIDMAVVSLLWCLCIHLKKSTTNVFYYFNIKQSTFIKCKLVIFSRHFYYKCKKKTGHKTTENVMLHQRKYILNIFLVLLENN